MSLDNSEASPAQLRVRGAVEAWTSWHHVHMSVLRLVVERGAKKTFASAVDWPGWSRSGRSEAEAIDVLLAYRDRFEPVVARAGLRLPVSMFVDVVEVLDGNATTDFGAPGAIAAIEREPAPATRRRQAVALLQSAWDTFEDVEAAAPRSLRKGPRGGGRDTDAIREHLLDTEQAYKGKLGIRGVSDHGQLRAAILQAVRNGRTPAQPAEWPSAYAARRIAWHALDHAWEIQDKS